MKRTQLIYVGIGLVSVIALGLLGWWFFISSETGRIAAFNAARGFGSDTPIFDGGSSTNGSLGSTNRNILGGITDVLFSSRGDSTVGSAADSKDASAAGVATTTEDTQKPVVYTAPRLWRLTSVASAGVHPAYATSTHDIYFVERPTGHLFRANPVEKKVERITNTLFPRTVEAEFGADMSLVLRQLDERTDGIAFLANVVATSSNAYALDGDYLEPDITAVAGSRDGYWFYIVETTDGGVGILQDRESKRSRIFESALSGWTAHFREAGDIVLTQHAARSVSGSGYLLTRDGETSPLVTNIRGLTLAVHPRTRALVYGESVTGRIELFSRLPGEKSVRLPIRTWADKCAFDPTEETIVYCAVPQVVPQAVLPDAWYRGEVRTEDTLWRVDIKDGSTELLVSPSSEYSIDLDVIDPVVSTDGTHLLFLDRVTRTPWAYRLVQ